MHWENAENLKKNDSYYNQKTQDISHIYFFLLMSKVKYKSLLQLKLEGFMQTMQLSYSPKLKM